jgi:hypothetical protein
MLDIILEAFKSGTVLLPLLHQIRLFPDKLGILLGQLLLSKFLLFLRLF